MQKRSRKYLAFYLIIFVIGCSFLGGCSHKETLLFLNWGEYINYDMVEAFEKEYNCNVIVDLGDSNELFYAKVKSGTTAYDLVCPAEYMAEKMYLKGLIQPLYRNEEEKQKYFPTLASGEISFMDGVTQIEEKMDETMYEALGDNYKWDINQYHMPYFWGTFGLMYNKQLEYFKDEETYNVEDMDNPILIANEPDGYPDVLQKNNAWKVYFFDQLSDGSTLPSDIKVGQYSAVRFAYGAAMTYAFGTPNTPVSEGIEKFREILSRRKYTQWAADELKHSIEKHSIDLAFAYTGDCLDMAYLRFTERGVSFEDLDFFTYAPQVTIAHIDTLVIPTNARHADLARKFINFLLQPENAWLNNRDIGYLPPLQQVYDMIVEMRAPEVSEDSYLYFEETAEELFWRENWAKAIKAIEPRANMELTPFSYLDTEDINKLQNVVNNVKIS